MVDASLFPFDILLELEKIESGSAQPSKPLLEFLAKQGALDARIMRRREACREMPAMEMTMLGFLCDRGSLGSIELLLNMGADPLAPSDRGATPLALCSRHDRMLPAAAAFIERGADIEAAWLPGHSSTLDGERPLHFASAAGAVGIAKLLISRGADVHALQGGRMTPLHLAARAGRLNTAQLLCGLGADPRTPAPFEGVSMGAAEMAALAAAKSRDGESCFEWLHGLAAHLDLDDELAAITGAAPRGPRRGL